VLRQWSVRSIIHHPLYFDNGLCYVVQPFVVRALAMVLAMWLNPTMLTRCLCLYIGFCAAGYRLRSQRSSRTRPQNDAYTRYAALKSGGVAVNAALEQKATILPSSLSQHVLGVLAQLLCLVRLQALSRCLLYFACSWSNVVRGAATFTAGLVPENNSAL